MDLGLVILQFVQCQVLDCTVMFASVPDLHGAGDVFTNLPTSPKTPPALWRIAAEFQLVAAVVVADAGQHVAVRSLNQRPANE
jgi:hypothetical protein